MRQARRPVAAALAVALVPWLHGCGDDVIRGEVPQRFTRERRDAGSAQPIVERAAEIEQTLVRVADWALDNPAPFDVRDWPMAPLYDGLIDVSLVTGDATYLAAVIRAGRRSRFTSGSDPYHADGHAAGHAWLRIYLMMVPKDPGLLEPFKELFDGIAAEPIVEEWAIGERPPPGRRVTDRWTWADALYMSPPTIALLARATGDDRYLQFMDAEFQFAYRELFDVEANLFYRDATYIGDRTPNGHKLFWSRGSAWVYAGLALTLEALPADHPTRAFYVALLARMATAVRAAQQADGFWYPSLLDPEHVLIPETSGSALFVLGTAWGVRRGVLERETYWPVVERGWRAITTVIDRDGAVNSVQPPAERPEVFDPESPMSYGTGAVLMAGSEILRALEVTAPVDPAELVRRAQQLAPIAPDLSSECEAPCGSPEVPTGAVRADD